MENLRTIGGLLEALTDLRDAYGPECEIAVAFSRRGRSRRGSRA